MSRKLFPTEIPARVQILLQDLSEWCRELARDKDLGFPQRFSAADYGGQIREILNPEGWTAAERRQQAIAYAYAIRLELYGSGKWKKARGDTAEAHYVADTSVSKYSTRWGKLARARLEQVVSQRPVFTGARVANRRERILRSELCDLEDGEEGS